MDRYEEHSYQTWQDFCKVFEVEVLCQWPMSSKGTRPKFELSKGEPFCWPTAVAMPCYGVCSGGGGDDKERRKRTKGIID